MRHLFLIALIGLISCKAQKEAHSTMGDAIEGLVLLDHDNFTTIDTFQIREIRDFKTLNKFYREINKTRKPGLPVPMVDFTKDMLVLVCLGEQQGKKEVALSQLRQNETETWIAVDVWDVQQEEGVSIQPMYFPFYLYKMPLVDKTLHFQRVEK
ncbi:hypothetical protein [Flagellimonas marinaquae]|uniref:hypothetical protein n=1 Tax=Flagellimonas marinaquae TaxID=254955 RepID=UPI000F8E24BF|nr:hypothetical protein [Allomuricauda aquimarina]